MQWGTGPGVLARVGGREAQPCHLHARLLLLVLVLVLVSVGFFVWLDNWFGFSVLSYFCSEVLRTEARALYRLSKYCTRCLIGFWNQSFTA